MLTFFIYLVTFLLIVDCLLLSLLILVQLPKKEAGVGMAFGGGAADALFGAGSGNALSNLTKYTSIAFFLLVFVLSVLNNRMAHSSDTDFRKEFLQSATTLPTPSLSAATNNVKAPMTSNAPAIPLTITSNTVAPVAPAVSNAPVK